MQILTVIYCILHDSIKNRKGSMITYRHELFEFLTIALSFYRLLVYVGNRECYISNFVMGYITTCCFMGGFSLWCLTPLSTIFPSNELVHVQAMI